MKNHGLFAFVLTTGVLVPAAAHYLTAGHDQVVKFVAGNTSELTLDGAKIEARLAHPLVDPGEPLQISLTASGAKGKRLAVGVLVYGASGNEGDRVPSPPVGVAHKTVTIPIDAAGNGSTEISVPLVGAAGNRFYPAAFVNYEVLVLAPRAANKLDSLRSRTALIGGDEGIPWYNAAGDQFMHLYRFHGEQTGEDAALFGEDVVARLDAHTRAINKSIALHVPDTAPAGKAFGVTVAVTNPTKRAMTGLQLELETPAGVVDDAEGLGALVMPDDIELALAPGETKQFELRVMPSDTGVLGLFAHVSCHGEECSDDNPLTIAGTFDATEIVEAPAADDAPSIIGRK